MTALYCSTSISCSESHSKPPDRLQRSTNHSGTSKVLSGASLQQAYGSRFLCLDLMAGQAEMMKHLIHRRKRTLAVPLDNCLAAQIWGEGTSEKTP